MLTAQDEVEVLGVTYNFGLVFRIYIKQLARQALRKLASLRSLSRFLDDNGCYIRTYEHKKGGKLQVDARPIRGSP
ncbi:hypothetical protein E2C01_055628 [Portunus trituberculatus]|uniref:Uncharacterized protein n=1 Tax=Portunus trituberculatus TaxID=210409 RepID=A0A5B7GW25_PORTR|nr:hypothetical protein [Portunus trituberculatus]